MEIGSGSLDGMERFSSSSDSSNDDDELVELLLVDKIFEYERKLFNKMPVRISTLSGSGFVAELLRGSDTVCYELLRMKKSCFVNLCDVLSRKGYLEDSRGVGLAEKVAMFLFIIGHNIRHRVVADRFQHSTETVSRHFKEVLRAVCLLGKELIKPESTDLPEQIKANPKYYPWFKVSCFLMHYIIFYILIKM